MTRTGSLRTFVIAPTEPLVTALVDALSVGFEARGSTDPRAIKAFSAEGPVAAVLVTENLERPTPNELATALRSALDDTAFILVTRGVRNIAADGPFQAGLSYPVAPKILVSNVRRAIRAARASQFDPREMQADIELRSIGLDQKNHYEVLGVPPRAGVDEVTRAYDALSLRLHPDRLRRLDDETRELGMLLYLRIGEAYRTLRSRTARVEYDHALSGGRAPTQVKPSTGALRVMADWSESGAARKYLDLAQKALIHKDTKMALAHLRFALTQDEDNSLIAEKISELEGPTAAKLDLRHEDENAETSEDEPNG